MPSDLTPKGQLGIKWAEFLDSGSTMDASFAGAGESRAAMVIEIDGKDYTPELPGKILGFATTIKDAAGAAVASPTGLYRVLPMHHPKWLHLYAQNISSIRGIGPSGGTGHGDTNYERYLLTISFGTLPFRVLPDGNTEGREANRFVEFHTKPNSEVVKTEKNDWIVSDPAYTGSDPKAKASVGKILSRRHITLKWYRVPPPYVATKWGVTTNIDRCVGKVNDAAWPDADGFPAGTLLCEDPEITPVVAPVSPGVIWGADLGNKYSPILWDITLHLKYFNPDTTSQYRGHNLHYHSDSKFYRILRNEAGSTKTRYDTASFDLLFQKV